MLSWDDFNQEEALAPATQPQIEKTSTVSGETQSAR